MNVSNYLIAIFLFFSSCSAHNSKKDNGIQRFDFKKPNKITITNRLKEISGITNSKDGNIFAINDELGVIYKLNPITGNRIKNFSLGKWTVEGDFEGITAADNFVYAITSNGVLYKFIEGLNKEAVDYETIKLPFSSKFEIEGLCYDKELNGLAILPKEYAGKKFKHQRAVYFYSFLNNKVKKKPLILISLKKLKEKFNIKDFYPSGIEKDPITGNYFIVSARGSNVLVEVDKLGNIIHTKKLKESIHRQPEGITVLNDGTLIISDEAAGKRPSITRYSIAK